MLSLRDHLLSLQRYFLIPLALLLASQELSGEPGQIGEVTLKEYRKILPRLYPGTTIKVMSGQDAGTGLGRSVNQQGEF